MLQLTPNRMQNSSADKYMREIMVAPNIIMQISKISLTILLDFHNFHNYRLILINMEDKIC
jgi:hypothetical protein